MFWTILKDPNSIIILVCIVKSENLIYTWLTNNLNTSNILTNFWATPNMSNKWSNSPHILYLGESLLDKPINILAISWAYHRNQLQKCGVLHNARNTPPSAWESNVTDIYQSFLINVWILFIRWFCGLQLFVFLELSPASTCK